MLAFISPVPELMHTTKRDTFVDRRDVNILSRIYRLQNLTKYYLVLSILLDGEDQFLYYPFVFVFVFFKTVLCTGLYNCFLKGCITSTIRETE